LIRLRKPPVIQMHDELFVPDTSLATVDKNWDGGKHMGAYPNMWEFAPAGLMEPNQQPEDIIERELEEETGLMLSSPPTAVAIFFDEEVNTWEIVFQLVVVGECQADGTEYESLAWFDINSMPTPMSPPARQMKSLL